MDQPQPRRVQFCLRTLLLAFVPVAIVALPVGYWIRRPRPPLAPRPVPVSGTVTLDGVPLDGATVVFMRIETVPLKGARVTYLRGGYGAGGTTDSVGKFALNMPIAGLRPCPGCYPGSYAVTVSKWEMTNGQPGGILETPQRYYDLDMPCMTAEVTFDGPNSFAFDLTSE
jgi:hypothetical protein